MQKLRTECIGWLDGFEILRKTKGRLAGVFLTTVVWKLEINNRSKTEKFKNKQVKLFNTLS